jgi:tetratricopeptide (TPR) repeat protein
MILTFRTIRLSNTNLKDSSRSTALFAALLFVSHPVQTQAVTYIVQRFASMATMFYLLTLVLYIKWRLKTTEQQSSRLLSFLRKQESIQFRLWIPAFSGMTGSLLLYLAVLVSVVLAMKTKETAFTIPFVIALYEFMFFKGKTARRILYLMPFFLMMLIIPLSYLSLAGMDRTFGELISDVGEATAIRHTSRLEYLLTEFRVIVTYLRLLFLPVNQNFVYDYPVFHSFFEPPVFLSLLFLLSILCLGFYLYYRSRITDRALRIAAFGIFWFFITLSVESGVIPLHPIQEHRVYLPSVGFFTAVATALFVLIGRLKNQKVKKAVVIAFFLVPFILACAAYARNAVWQSEIGLWEDVIKKSPGSEDARINLGIVYKSKGLFDKAIEQHAIAIKLNPNNANAYNCLGTVYLAKGLTDRAIKYYETALSLNSDYADAHFNLANVYLDKGLTDMAIAHYKSDIRLIPDDAEAHFNLGLAYQKKGMMYEARKEFDAARLIDPALYQARQPQIRKHGKEK